MAKTRTIIGIACIIGIVILGISAYVSLSVKSEAVHYNELGIKAMEEGDYDKAIEYFTKAIELDPNFAEAYYNRGNAYGNEEQFHRYFKLPGQTFAQAGFPEMQEKFEKAVSDFKKCMKVDPSYSPLAHFGLGNVYFLYYCGYKNRAEYVIPEYEKALEGKDFILEKAGKEGLAAVYANLARTYLAMAELEKAKEYYEKSIEIYPIDTAYEHLIWVYIEFGNFEDAYKVAQEYLKYEEWEADLGLMPTVIAAYHLGNYEVAKKCAEEIVKKFPESAYLAEAHRFLALIYMKEGKTDEVKKELEKDIEICTEVINNPETIADVPGAYYERGLAYYYLGNYTKSIEDFKWLIDNPKYSKREVAHENYYLEGHINLACVYSKIGEFENAKGVLKKILDELDKDVDFTGWKKYVKDDVEEILSKIEAGKEVEIPSIFSEVSH